MYQCWQKKIFQRNNFLAHISMMRLPPPLITLDRSDGVQTTAAFPSHPTWGPGIPIAWSQAGEHTLPSCSTSTLATASKKRASPTRLQYKTYQMYQLHHSVMRSEHYQLWSARACVFAKSQKRASCSTGNLIWSLESPHHQCISLLKEQQQDWKDW